MSGRRPGQKPISPEIVEQAQRLRETGATWARIKTETGETLARLRYAIDPNFHAAALRAGCKNKRNAGLRARREISRAAVECSKQYEDAPKREPRPEQPNPTPPADVMAAARAFAQGEIDRVELMRRIGKRS